MNVPTPIPRSKDGKELIFIPGDSFQMGCDEGFEKHRPQHVVTLAGFFLDRFPVTNAEYKRFVDETGHPVPHYTVNWCDTRDYNWDRDMRTYPQGKGDHPVVLVTWKDAMTYAEWAGKRLPTEAEWELAARGPSGRSWPWGSQPEFGRSNTSEAGAGGTTPVTRFSPAGDSQEGVSDLIGNVWEWTSSLFSLYPYDAKDGRESIHSDGWRVLRGGSWLNDLYTARAYTRLDGDFLFFSNVGFRCAVSKPA